MTNEDMQRLQAIAELSKNEKLKASLPAPDLDALLSDAMRTGAQLAGARDSAAKDMAEMAAKATEPRPQLQQLPLNRKQRRKAGQKAKRPNSDPAIHRYAENVRHMTDAQIWAEGHRKPDQQVVEAVARDVHEDILSVLAPHFDDHTMHRIADILGRWYGIDQLYTFADSNREALDKAYVPAPRVPGAAEPVVVGQVYKHFKGNYYRVTALAKMATALELDDSSSQRLDGMDMVVYQTLDPNHPDWFLVRPVSEFISATPDKYLKKNPAFQPYHFMLVTERTENNDA